MCRYKMQVTDQSISATKEGAGVLIRTLEVGDEKGCPKIGDSCLVSVSDLCLVLLHLPKSDSFFEKRFIMIAI